MSASLLGRPCPSSTLPPLWAHLLPLKNTNLRVAHNPAIAPVVVARAALHTAGRAASGRWTAGAATQPRLARSIPRSPSPRNTVWAAQNHTALPTL